MKKKQSKAIRIIAVILLIAGTVLVVVPLGFKTYFRVQADDNVEAFEAVADSENFDRLLENYYTYSPYRKGLPSGPICNPGIKAIEAALNPNDTDYQFFLTDKSGTKFYYASTYEQHLKNGKEAGIMN